MRPARSAAASSRPTPRRGGNFIDTANRYTEGTSERFVGEFVGSERERFVVAAKDRLSTKTGDLNAGGNHRKNMVQAREASLRRLTMDYVDLFCVHAWDFLTPVEEVLRKVTSFLPGPSNAFPS